MPGVCAGVRSDGAHREAVGPALCAECGGRDHEGAGSSLVATRAYISFGSNIAPEDNVRRALLLLAREMRVVGLATVYRTKPVGRPEQGDYLNGIVAMESELGEGELRAALREIERKLGRVRSDDRYAARTMDLDLVGYGKAVAREASERAFVGVPLAELAPGLRANGKEETLEEAAGRMSREEMVALPEFTRRLREELGLEH
ncbi:MAG: 2-amino-4-hydroxy-6-hydroxymethyldihydropteridine diphosphokinase [Armatimonadia bacterium]